MSTQKKIITQLIIFLLCILYTNIAYTQTLIYKTIDSGKEFIIEIIVNKFDDGFLIKTTDSYKNEMTYNSDPLFSILKWEYYNSEKGIDISAKRSENTILLTGRRKNKKYEKKYKIGKLPWYQDWKWGLELKTFINSDKNSICFSTIDPDRLWTGRLEVKKEKIEMIELNGKMIETVHAKISIKGWKKIFWSGGDMWFRKSDGTFIFGKMDPGDPQATIQLIKEE